MGSEFTHIPPQDLDSEAAFIGSLLLADPKDLLAFFNTGQIAKDDFYREANANIFEAAVKVLQEKQLCDLVLLTAALKNMGLLEKVGGSGHLSSCIECVTNPAAFAQYAREVRIKSVLRQLIKAGSNLMDQGFSTESDPGQIIAHTRLRLEEINELIAPFAASQKLDFDTLSQVSPFFSEPLNDACEGLPIGDLTVIAGEQAIGKTAFTLDQALYTCEGGEGVLIFNTRESKAELSLKLLCSITGAPKRVVRSIKFQQGPEYAKAKAILAPLPIHVCCSPGTIALPTIVQETFATKTVLEKAGIRLSLVSIDCLQDIDADPSQKSQATVDKLRTVTEKLRWLFHEAGCASLVVTKLGPDGEVAGYKNLKYDARLSLFINGTPGIAAGENSAQREILIFKHDGPTGTKIPLDLYRCGSFVARPPAL